MRAGADEPAAPADGADFEPLPAAGDTGAGVGIATLAVCGVSVGTATTTVRPTPITTSLALAVPWSCTTSMVYPPGSSA